ncbi:related to GYP1 - cis-golgi GTPase-activating protein [Melanopsichium pennsylvanicum]|uniref:Related to GYP1 - cis-golgi GTPase-activating protein n=2 Tax=Melanopsichium pennsylvanicum TaxID=63383 RepID=A0AAJ4XHR9_9BASI|nr:gtpase-activating protein [Melanopsichium pennsylvanicum 4]SNX82552.1 related to GYP1 - cis-golgi GTPase-activating protein [Melanopsichium pennsylvanicum]
MSSTQARTSNSASAAAGRDRSLLQLLDPNDLLPGHTTADLYSLRHFILRGGLPDSPSWLRAQAWKILLGYLPPDKKEWSSTLAKRRKEYYHFLNDLSPSATSSHHPIAANQLTNSDRLLDQIYKDLVRSRKNGFAFYQAEPRPSTSCPIVPVPSNHAQSPEAVSSCVQRLESKDNLLLRLAAISHEYAQQLSLERIASSTTTNSSRQPPHILHVQKTSDLQATNGRSLAIQDPIKSPPILLSPPSPGSMSCASSQHSFTSASEAFEAAASNQAQDHVQDAAMASADSIVDKSLRSREAPDSIPTQRNWHSLLRILYLFALLNPSIGYVQGMNEALFTLLYVLGSAQYPSTAGATLTPSNSQQTITNAPDGSLLNPWDNNLDLANLTTHAEADAFWCFSAMIGEMQELYDFDRVEQQSRASTALADHQPSASGMAYALRRFSLRIKWLDPPLWRDLQASSLDPRLPYYSLRWLACLLSTELSLPSVLRIWDALLTEQENASVAGSAKIEFLIDVCASMVLQIKHQLPSSKYGIDLETEGFSRGMRVLQNYPDDDIGPVMEAAILMRQRRLAADLTGDGPPQDIDDDEATNPRLAAVKARAAQAWREWTSPQQSNTSLTSQRVNEQVETSAPATKGGWLVSRTRPRPSLPTTDEADSSFASSAGGAVSDVSTPSKSTFSGFLAKYAEAVQSSDAAANFSKASTNLTAKAMARFGDRGSRETTPETATTRHDRSYGSLGRGFPASPTSSVSGTNDSRVASLGSIGAGLFNRTRRNASESQSSSVGYGSPRTPDMTLWSRDTMPDFPLPNVADSPAGRMEYIDTFGKRISMAPNGRVGASPSSSVTGDDGERRGSENGLSSFPLPSMRAAARMGILSARFREESASPNSRAAGPKPLLLSQSARPPREGSNSPGSLAVDEPSRKVSSGPMGHSMSRGNSHQDGRSSVADSFSGRSSRSVSAAGSRHSSMADFADTGMPGLAEPDTLPPLPSLTGQNTAAALLGHSTASIESHPVPIRTLPSSAVSKDGTVSAGAFTRATTKPADSEQRPEFGHIASSSDVPLVQATSASISRPRASNRKRTSSSTVESRTASTSGSLTGAHLSNRSSQTTNIADASTSQNATSSLSFIDSNGLGEGASVVEEPEWMIDPVEKSAQNGTWQTGEVMALEEGPTDAIELSSADAPSAEPRKYTLTDEPLPTTSDTQSINGSTSIVRTKRYVKGRQGSSSSVATNSSRRSLAGLRRSSRTSLGGGEPVAAPASPQLALPEVDEQLDAYGGMTDPSWSENPLKYADWQHGCGDALLAGADGNEDVAVGSETYAAAANELSYPNSPVLGDDFDFRSLGIRDVAKSTLVIDRSNSGGSTDRSNFI